MQGAAWPFQAAWLSSAQFLHGQPHQGYLTLQSTARHTFENELGALTELYSGNQNIWPAEAVSHQGFSSTGVALPAVIGLLGLDSDIQRKMVSFRPGFPPDWKEVTVENYRLGPGSVDLRYRRNNDKIVLDVRSRGLDGFNLVFEPVGAACMEGGKGTLGSRPLTFQLDCVPMVEILPFDRPFETGNTDRGLKLIEQDRQEKTLRLRVEGLAGERYEIRLTHPEQIMAVRGGKLENGRISVEIPPSPQPGFVPHLVEIAVK